MPSSVGYVCPVYQLGVRTPQKKDLETRIDLHGWKQGEWYAIWIALRRCRGGVARCDEGGIDDVVGETKQVSREGRAGREWIRWM